MKNNLILLRALFFIYPILSCSSLSKQLHSEDYFIVSKEDKTRWETYVDFIQNSKLDPLTKADSIYQFALAEYELGQFSKTRELCEIANSLNSDLSKTHFLIGKAYLANSCNSLAWGRIWLAIEEWEVALEKDKKNQIIKMYIEGYSKLFPTKEELYSDIMCPQVNEGDRFFVGCWIQRETRVRFRKNN